LVQHLESTDPGKVLPDPGDVSSVPFDYARVFDDDVALDPRLDAAQFEAIKNELLGAGCTKTAAARSPISLRTFFILPHALTKATSRLTAR
jgi:hypothetical protein